MSSPDSDQGPLEEAREASEEIGTKIRRLWSKQEDERLRLLVSYWGDQGGRRSNWDKIAANFENRSAKSCRKRWFHSLDPKLRRGRWNKTEDKILKESYDRLGPAWQRIAQLIPGRTDDQCAKRYNDVVCPDVQDRLRPWEPEEDEKLLSLHAKHGSKWQTIATEMPRRTGLTCRNRWRKLTRPVKSSSRSESADGQEQTSGPADDHGANGSIRAMGPMGPSAESQDTVLPFDVPGSSQIAGYPAGADANWFLAASGSNYGSGGGLLPLVGPPGSQRHLTVTVDDPGHPPQNLLQQTHHTISDLQLDRVLDFAAKNDRQVVIHQHIYQMQLPPPGSPVMAVNHPPPHVPSSGMSPASPGFMRPMGEDQPSTLLRTVHPPVQPPERPPSRPGLLSGDPYAKGPHHHLHHQHHHHDHSIPAPPPDEFLSRPLLFDGSSENNMFPLDTEEVDFMAFNPS